MHRFRINHEDIVDRLCVVGLALESVDITVIAVMIEIRQEEDDKDEIN